MGYPFRLIPSCPTTLGIDRMRLKPFSAILFAIGTLSAVVQPVLAQTGGAPTEQVIPAGDTTYRGRFTVDPATGAVTGSGKVEWRNGNRYEGPVQNNQLTGKGKFAWSNGDRYEGDMVNAEPHGQGTYYFKGGDRYSGAWNNGQKHGQGRYTFEDGSYWEGQYANDRQVSGGMGYASGKAADTAKTTTASPAPAREALPTAAAEPKRESVQPAKTRGGDPNKYSTTPGNPSCRFFDGFADNGDGTVTDPRNGLVWKRCAEGYEWNGHGCTGSSLKTNWISAMDRAKQSRFLGREDWRLPTKKEMEMVVGVERTGGKKICDGNFQNKPTQFAASPMITHEIDTGRSVYFGEYWTSSAVAGDSEKVWYVDFVVGARDKSQADRIYNTNNIRLVRSPAQSKGGDARNEEASVDRYRKQLATEEAEREKKWADIRSRNAKSNTSAENSRSAQCRERKSDCRMGCDFKWAVSVFQGCMSQCNSICSE